MLFSTPDTRLTTPKRDKITELSASDEQPAVVSISRFQRQFVS